MTELFLRPLADAFMQVGVFVALMLGLFGYVQYRTGDRITRFLAARWRTAPLIGALLGVSPGCGGAILVMPLYLRGTVSFGTVIAALVATMGDASFVILAADFELALWLHAMLLIAGICAGYLTDALRIDPRVRADIDVAKLAVSGGRPVTSVGAAEAFPPPMAISGPHPPLEAMPRMFWAVATAGFVVGTPVVMGVVDGVVLVRLFAGVDPYLVTGVLGSAIAAAIYLRSGVGLGDDSIESMEQKRQSLAGMLRHGARETSFVTFWVAIAYLATTWIIDVGGIDLAAVVAAAGIGGVLIGAGIGLIPGCAVQVVLTGLYTSGMVPLATLVANALSQDGDALFPLVMMDRRSAVTATVLTTVPGLLGGTAALLLVG
jgi:Putative, 10TM heavy-metal exporter